MRTVGGSANIWGVIDPEELIWAPGVSVTLASNLFINVPVILAYDSVPIISTTNRVTGGQSLKFDLYDKSGDRFAVVKGARIHETSKGSSTGLEIVREPNRAIAVNNGTELFELNYVGAASVSVVAELYTPTGMFIRALKDEAVSLLDADGLVVGGYTVKGSVFMDSNGINLNPTNPPIVSED